MWLLLPTSILYVHGTGQRAPVYVAGAGIVVAALAGRLLRRDALASIPGSYFAICALAIYSALTDIASGEAISPNAGNLALGVSAALLAFRKDVDDGFWRAVRGGAWLALVIIALDRLAQLTPFRLSLYEDGSASSAVSTYYDFKGSYIAGDSNALGLFLLALLPLLYRTAPSVPGKLRVLEYILQALTFSKASLGALVARDVVGARMANWKKAIAVAFVAIPVVYVLSSIDLEQDLASGVVKLETALMFREVATETNVTSLVFGRGNNTAIGDLGIYLHAWPLTVTYELGLLGLGLMLLYLALSYRESPGLFLSLHVPIFLLSGMSFFFYLGSAWIYLPQYLILTFEREHRSKETVGE